MVHLCWSRTNREDEIDLTGACVCVCIYMSFFPSQVNHEMFPKLLHVTFVYLYTQSPQLCWITKTNKKKAPLSRRKTLKTRPPLASEVRAGSDSHG